MHLIYIGAGLFVVSVALRVGLEGYFTSKYCEELIHKFEEYYIINAQSIRKSYKQYAEYLINTLVCLMNLLNKNKII